MGADEDRNRLVRSTGPLGAHVSCAPSFFPGDWDAVVTSAEVFFAEPSLRRGAGTPPVLVFGPPHLFRSAWLAGATDYLKEPWTPEEAFLRLGGPRSSTVSWEWAQRSWRLAGLELSMDGREGVAVSAAEAELLRLLVQRQGTTVSRRVLGWAAACSDGRVIDTLVCRLRKKLRRLAETSENPVISLRGQGYRIP